MTSPETLLIHVGPLRNESVAIQQRLALPALVISPGPKEQAGATNQKHVRALVAPKAGEATRYHYNLPGFESLAPATGLKALYPGLRETRRQPVETQTLDEALNEHGVPVMSHLVLEQPDNALALLRAWQAEGRLGHLRDLYVRTSPASLYRGMPTQEELVDWCVQHGFDVLGASGEDPEFSLLSFRRSPLYAPLQAARQEASALQVRLDEEQAQLDEYKTLLQQNAQQLKDAASALRDSDATLQQRTQELEGLVQERDALARACNAAQAEHRQLAQQRDEQSRARATAQVERDRFRQERDRLRQECDKLKQESAQLAQQRDEQARARAAAQAEVATLAEARDGLVEQQGLLVQERDALARKYRALEQQHDAQAKALQAAQAERDTLEQESGQLRQQHDEAAEERNSARAERDTLKAQLAKAQTANQQTEEQLQQARDGLTNLKQQLEESTERLKEGQAEQKTLQQTLNKRTAELEKTQQERDQFQRDFQSRKEKHEAAEAQLEEARQAQAEKDAIIARLSEQLAAQQHNSATTQNRFAELESRLESLFGEQRSYIQQTTNALGQHITRQGHTTVETVQTCIEAQKALGASSQALSYGGKTLPNATALLLNRLLEHNSYDVVLDIGAGVTTTFLASALQQVADHKRIAQRSRSGKEVSGDTHVEAYTVAEAGELPKRLQAFTHSREQGQALGDHLRRQGAEALVAIHLAPLVEVPVAGQATLFYDLKRTLQRLGDLFEGRTARVLVVYALEQQPASAKAEALLPTLLQHLASHTLELVVLPGAGAQSSGLQHAWVDCLQTRELTHQLTEDARSSAWMLNINE